MTKATLSTDGGARGNPGPGGAGFVIEIDGETVCRGGRFLGTCTNNVAEYQALIWGLENARTLAVADILVRADSELLVKQINGVYRVKNEGLKPLFAKALRLLREFESFKVTHVRREQNQAADALANEAMDLRRSVGDYVCEPGGTTATDSLF